MSAPFTAAAVAVASVDSAAAAHPQARRRRPGRRPAPRPALPRLLHPHGPRGRPDPLPSSRVFQPRQPAGVPTENDIHLLARPARPGVARGGSPETPPEPRGRGPAPDPGRARSTHARTQNARTRGPRASGSRARGEQPGVPKAGRQVPDRRPAADAGNKHARPGPRGPPPVYDGPPSPPPTRQGNQGHSASPTEEPREDPTAPRAPPPVGPKAPRPEYPPSPSRTHFYAQEPERGQDPYSRSPTDQRVRRNEKNFHKGN